jgi:hypothetical protein
MGLECVRELASVFSRDLAFVDLLAQGGNASVELKMLQHHPRKQWLGALVTYAEWEHQLFLFPEVLDGLVMEEAEELSRSRRQIGAIPAHSHTKAAGLCQDMMMIVGQGNQARMAFGHVMHSPSELDRSISQS